MHRITGLFFSFRTDTTIKKIKKYINKNYNSDSVAIALADFTDFEWDAVLVFRYPTAHQDIKEALGVEYEKSLDLTAGLIFVKDNEIVNDILFEDDFSNPPPFYIYAYADINQRPTYRVFTQDEAIFVCTRCEIMEGNHKSYYSYILLPDDRYKRCIENTNNVSNRILQQEIVSQDQLIGICQTPDFNDNLKLDLASDLQSKGVEIYLTDDSNAYIRFLQETTAGIISESFQYKYELTDNNVKLEFIEMLSDVKDIPDISIALENDKIVLCVKGNGKEFANEVIPWVF